MGVIAIGVLIAVVLFADRVGPDEELKRRLYQVGFAVVLVLFIAALSSVLSPTPDQVDGLGFTVPDDALAAETLKERSIIVVGAAVLTLLAALYRSTEMPTLAIATMLGSLLLMIGVILDSSSFSYYQFLFDGGELRNGIYAAVTGIGLGILFFYGYREWDQPGLEAEEA